MEFISVKKRVELILAINGTGHSAIVHQFNTENPLTKITNTDVSNLLRRFKETGTVLSYKESIDRFRKKKSYEQEEVDKVRYVVEQDAHTSIRRSELVTNISKIKTGEILKEGNFFPYKIQEMQELKHPGDNQRRLFFCLWLKERVNANPDFLRTVLWSDEATFMTNGMMNRQNFRLWHDENPHWHIENKNQGAQKVTVWIGIMDTHLIGPYFFEENVNGANYLEMLQNFLLPVLTNIGVPQFLQQDGAPPHFATVVKDWLNFHFPNRWIGRGGPVEWAPRSPDLSPLDFYLWGHLKDSVYKTKIESIEHLKQRITHEAQLITGEHMLNSLVNMEKRIQLCIHEEGGLFEHLMK